MIDDGELKTSANTQTPLSCLKSYIKKAEFTTQLYVAKSRAVNRPCEQSKYETLTQSIAEAKKYRSLDGWCGSLSWT